MRVGGVDPSLTATGVAVVINDTLAGGGVTFYASADTVVTEGHRADNLHLRRDRLHSIVDFVRTWLGDPDLVVVESLPPGAAMSSPSYLDRAGLFWLIVDAFRARDVPVAQVSPSGRMIYQTGRGGRPAGMTAAQWKAACFAATRTRYPWVSLANDNEGDALTLAAMGSRHVGFSLEAAFEAPSPLALPTTHVAGLAKVVWPDILCLDL